MEFGIPVHSKFLTELKKNTEAKKFGLDPNMFTILISTGSFSIGAVEHMVESLHQDVQILVVCANNKVLYRYLKAKNYPHVFVFGFIDNLQELMAVSEVIITKPGGLTIAESLVMELLPFFITAIPGHEAVNAEILAGYGVGISSRDIVFLKKTILELKNHPEKIKTAKEKIAKIKKPSSAREIANVVCQGGLRPRS
jgi:processive 1,2-diacylglycerol beta-glucosyltransferase